MPPLQTAHRLAPLPHPRRTPARPIPGVSDPCLTCRPKSSSPASRRSASRPTTVEHEPVFTVAESRHVKAGIPGAHSKNLFVKDKKGRLFLITARDETAIDLKRLHGAIGASGRALLRLGRAAARGPRRRAGLGDALRGRQRHGRAVTMVLDASLMEHERMNFHPLVNSMTTTVSREDLLAFLRDAGHEPMIISLPEPEGEWTNAGPEPM